MIISNKLTIIILIVIIIFCLNYNNLLEGNTTIEYSNNNIMKQLNAKTTTFATNLSNHLTNTFKSRNGNTITEKTMTETTNDLSTPEKTKLLELKNISNKEAENGEIINLVELIKVDENFCRLILIGTILIKTVHDIIIKKPYVKSVIDLDTIVEPYSNINIDNTNTKTIEGMTNEKQNMENKAKEIMNTLSSIITYFTKDKSNNKTTFPEFMNNLSITEANDYRNKIINLVNTQIDGPTGIINIFETIKLQEGVFLIGILIIIIIKPFLDMITKKTYITNKIIFRLNSDIEYAQSTSEISSTKNMPTTQNVTLNEILKDTPDTMNEMGNKIGTKLLTPFKNINIFSNLRF